MPHNLSEPAPPQDSAGAPTGAAAGAPAGAPAVAALGIAPGAAPHSRLTDLLERGRARLDRLDAEVLLAHVLRRPRSYLLAHGEDPAPAASTVAYEALLARAAAGEPLAYLTGQREFWSLPLQVCPAVLIPRPETELAVERCLALLAQRPCRVDGPCRVCDLGTGSGAIACALAAERPAWRITATDCSSAALHVARGNAARLGLDRIEFVEGDWLEPLGERRFDLLVSNPPYVGAADPALTALAHEPRLALSPGPDALAALGRIISLAPAHLVPGGYLVLEHGTDQGRAVERALVAAGYAHVRCHRDLAGHERVSEAHWLP